MKVSDMNITAKKVLSTINQSLCSQMFKTKNLKKTSLSKYKLTTVYHIASEVLHEITSRIMEDK